MHLNFYFEVILLDRWGKWLSGLYFSFENFSDILEVVVGNAYIYYAFFELSSMVDAVYQFSDFSFQLFFSDLWFLVVVKQNVIFSLKIWQLTFQLCSYSRILILDKVLILIEGLQQLIFLIVHQSAGLKDGLLDVFHLDFALTMKLFVFAL